MGQSFVRLAASPLASMSKPVTAADVAMIDDWTC